MQSNRNSGVTVWDSGNWIAGEYVRSCTYTWEKRRDAQQYFYCSDHIHTSNVALIQMNHLLINKLCVNY
jgi:hypothetical protein